MKIKLISLVILCFGSNFLWAQSTVKINDLKATKTIISERDNNSEPITEQSKRKAAEVSLAIVSVYFNIKNLKEKTKINLQIGTQEFDGSIVLESLEVLKDSANFESMYFVDKNKRFKANILGGGTSINFELKKDAVRQANFVSLVILDSKGLEQSKASFQLKN